MTEDTEIAQTWEEIGELEEKYDVLAGSTSPEAERALFEKYPLPWSAPLTAKADRLRQLVDEVTQAHEALSDDASLQKNLQLQKKMQAMRWLILALDSDLLDLYASVVGQQATAEDRLTVKTQPDREKVYP